MVCRLRQMGVNAYGADICLDNQTDVLRLIPTESEYRFPFSDCMFDAVISCSVLEHVTNLSEAAAEMYRVLKPGGFCLHFFPPKFRPIEDHTLVPFGGIFQGYIWLLLWSFIGLRNSFGKNRTTIENARHNYIFLKEKTAYRSRKELRIQMSRYFTRVLFVERFHIQHSYGRIQLLRPLVRIAPPLADLYSAFHLRVLFCEKSPVLSNYP